MFFLQTAPENISHNVFILHQYEYMTADGVFNEIEKN